MTMSDVRERLAAASRDLPTHTGTIEQVLRRHRRRARRSRIATAATALTIAAGAVGLVTHLGLGEAPPPVVPGATTDFELAPGESYVRTTWTFKANVDLRDPSNTPSFRLLRQDVRTDGSGAGTNETLLELGFFTSEDRRAYLDRFGLDASELRLVDRNREGGRSGLWDLPSDPDALRSRLLGRAATSDASPVAGAPGSEEQSAGLWHTLVWDVLWDASGPADVRAAAVQVAANLPAVEIDRNATDPVGRQAVAITFVDTTYPTARLPSGRSSDFTTDTIYADPQTFTPLALKIQPELLPVPLYVIVISQDGVEGANGDMARTFVSTVGDVPLPVADPRTI